MMPDHWSECSCDACLATSMPPTVSAPPKPEMVDHPAHYGGASNPHEAILAAAAKGSYLMGRMPGPLSKPEIILGFEDDRDAWEFLQVFAIAVKKYREDRETA